jgi:hypothetical protein
MPVILATQEADRMTILQDQPRQKQARPYLNNKLKNKRTEEQLKLIRGWRP